MWFPHFVWSAHRCLQARLHGCSGVVRSRERSVRAEPDAVAARRRFDELARRAEPPPDTVDLEADVGAAVRVGAAQRAFDELVDGNGAALVREKLREDAELRGLELDALAIDR